LFTYFFQGVYGDMYHSGYGYASYAPYTSPGSPAPSVGHDGSYYGTQQYQFPGAFYQPQIPKKTTYTKKNNTSAQGVVSASQVSDTPPLSADAANPGSNSVNGNKNMMKGSYVKVVSGNGVASPSYQNQTRAGKKSPWSEGNIFSDKQNVPTVTTGPSGNNKLQGKNQNHHPIPHYLVSLHIWACLLEKGCGEYNKYRNYIYFSLQTFPSNNILLYCFSLHLDRRLQDT
jgi:hypothetical protein